MNSSWKVEPWSNRKAGDRRRPVFAWLLLGSALAPFAVSAAAQGAPPVTIHGTVLGAGGQPVAGARVTLEFTGSAEPVEAGTDAKGAFTFSPVPRAIYQVSAQKAGLRTARTMIDPSAVGGNPEIRLILPDAAAALPQTMEFADQPNFTVAGVTDWTAVGGHGSDATLRTSEDLARQTAALKPQDAARGEGAPEINQDAAESRLRAAGTPGDNAGLHRLQAEADEKAGDPLAAVHEDEQAARLAPSEQNYFAWGSELLLHRAVWQAVEVFRAGSRLHPDSARMLTALGAALFAGDLFDEAAAKLCAASDLQPAESEAYSFMGRVVIAAPAPLACAEPRLARFAQQQPQNAVANYFYAMALLKRNEHTPDSQLRAQALSLLNKAVAADPQCADAYLQMGILAASQHENEDAIRDFNRAIAANPQLAEAHYRLGMAYDRQGEREKARQEFQQHDALEKAQAESVERQRKEVKQFLVVLQGQPVPTSGH